jgi:putative transposon-encoded protein
MKQRSIAQLLSSLLVCAVSAFTQLQAASVSDLTFSLIDNSTAYAVTDIDPNATGSLTVPSTHNGLPVTEIGHSAFRDSGITSIDLPDSLTSLGNSAFQNCTSLTGTVTIPAGVTVIPDECFRSTAITEVVFEGEVTSIGNSAFRDSGITSLDLPDSLTSLGVSAFYNCPSLSGTVTIPAGVTVIPDRCFRDTAITEVVFEGEVTSIGYSAFYGTDITSIELPGSLTSLGDYAFYGTGITSIELPGSLTSIGNSAFRNCPSLTGTVTIPAGVTVIPDSCFRDTAITEVVFEGEVTSIGYSAFYGTDITSIELPGSLTSLGDYAFAYCTSLTGTVTIPAGVTVIPDWCFRNTAITEVVFEGEVTSIGSYAFRSTYALERLVFRGSAPTVGSFAFYLMGRDVAGGTQIEVYESHRASFSGSPWTDYTFVGVPDPVLEAFALTSVFDPSNSSLSIHSHGEPGSAGASVTVQHRASLSAGDNWTDVPAADVSVSTDSQTGAVVRSLNVDPSTQSEGFYRLQYNP